MQQCGDCGKVYDESDYSGCPYCMGLLFEEEEDEYRSCPECNCCLYWDGSEWVCTNCNYSES